MRDEATTDSNIDLKETKVLDHGYVREIETWGSDRAIIEAARMSTAKGFLGWGPTCVECGWSKGDDHEVGCSHPDKWKAGDEKLLKYLSENHHDTPFEFAGLVIEVRAPIIVFREWHRHRTQSYNEASARYAALPALDYVPTIDRLMTKGGHLTKQAASTGVVVLNAADAKYFALRLEDLQRNAEDLYQWGLTHGVPKELARLSMTVGRYSTMRASANLRNWLAFERLRDAPNAQLEIQLYARAVGAILAKRFPQTWVLFEASRGR